MDSASWARRGQKTALRQYNMSSRNGLAVAKDCTPYNGFFKVCDENRKMSLYLGISGGKLLVVWKSSSLTFVQHVAPVHPTCRGGHCDDGVVDQPDSNLHVSESALFPACVFEGRCPQGPNPRGVLVRVVAVWVAGGVRVFWVGDLGGGFSRGIGRRRLVVVRAACVRLGRAGRTARRGLVSLLGVVFDRACFERGARRFL